MTTGIGGMAVALMLGGALIGMLLMAALHQTGLKRAESRGFEKGFCKGYQAGLWITVDIDAKDGQEKHS